MSKFNYEQFFKTKEVEYRADLIVTKIELTKQYYIHKDRYNFKPSDIINEEEFQKSFSQSKRPIILSDSYIELDLR